MVVWAHVVFIGSEEADIGIKEGKIIGKDPDTYEIYEHGYKYGVELNIRVQEKGELDDAEELFTCCVISPEQMKNYSTPTFGRRFYIVPQLTPQTLVAAVEEITKKINNTWGTNWHEIELKLSWFGRGEWDFMYERDTPVLHEDGSINYDPRAYYS